MSFWPPSETVLKDLRRLSKTDEPMPKGWKKRIFHRIGGDLCIYINDKLQLVFKAPQTLYNPAPPQALPTIKLHKGWVVQPLCSFEGRSEGFHELVVEIGDKNRHKWDLHLWNVGMWNGKPYLFDW